MHDSSRHRSASKRPWRMGWGYKDGKLSAFGDRDIVVLRGWPSPLAWRRTRTKPWQPTRKHADNTFQAVLCKMDVLQGNLYVEPEVDTSTVAPGEKLPFEQYYYAHIMPQEREIAHKFLSNTPGSALTELGRHTDRHWHMYCLFARCPGAVELAKEHPVLAYALASCWVFRKLTLTKPMRAVRSLLRKPVPAIWEWLGFPVNPIALGLYSWLRPRGLTIKRLLDYRRAMRNPVTQQLLFDLGPLDWECLELAVTPWMARMITGDLIRDLTNPAAWDLNWAEQVKEALIYLRMIGKDYEIQALPSFEKIAQVLESRTHFETMIGGDFLMPRRN
jgi:hypothetical protein